MSTAVEVVAVSGIDCTFEPRPWGFAVERAEEIATHWEQALARKPRMFDGRVLLLHRGAVVSGPEGGRVFRGAYLETSFSAFLAWRDLGMPEAGVRNGFGMAALCGSDGAYVLGEMAPHTANAGCIYFASGTPDPSDIVGGRVDIEGSIRRELAEETGLDPATVEFEAGLTLVMDPRRVGFMKRVCARESAAELAARIEAFLARELEPELSRIHVVRTRADVGPAVQSSCAAYLASVLRR